MPNHYSINGSSLKSHGWGFKNFQAREAAKQQLRQDRERHKLKQSQETKLDKLRAEADTVNRFGFSGLMYAVTCNKVSKVKEFLQEGVSPNLEFEKERYARKYRGVTALGIAVHKGFTEIVKLLLKAGADPNGGQVKPMKLAQIANNKEVVSLLTQALQKKDLHKPPRDF